MRITQRLVAGVSRVSNSATKSSAHDAVAVGNLNRTPLLELNDDCVLVVLLVGTSENEVNALRRGREREFNAHPGVVGNPIVAHQGHVHENHRVLP